jgi:4-hydroxybenzoate polyprenyltransferase
MLGLGLALAPIGAYLAVSSEFNIVPLLFSAAVLFWVSGFDIIYSLQDKEFDKTHKLHSMPVLLGKKNALMLSNILHLLTFSALSIAGSLGEFSLYYWIGFWSFSALLVYQHTLVKHNDLSKVNLAFFATNGLASLIFGAFVIADLLLK